MNNTEDNFKSINMRGDIEIFMRKGDEDIILFNKKNIIVDSGMEILARAIAGDLHINGMYLAYTNGASGVQPSPDKSRTADYYQTTASDSERGFMRVPTISEATFDSTDPARYNVNRASFIGLSDNLPAIPVAGNEIQAGTSKVYGAALAFLDPEDMTKDILYASVLFQDEANVVDEFPVIAGALIGVRWKQKFTNDN